MLVYPPPGRLSNSQMGLLLPGREGSCGLKWSFKYRLGMKEAPSLSMELGSAMDDALNSLLRRVLAGQPMDLQDGITALRERVALIPDDVADSATRGAECAALERAVQMFYERHNGWQGQDVQFRFEVKVPGVSVPVVGIIDRIDADGTVVDHKLSRSQRVKDGKLDPEWVAERRPQLALYLACLAIAEEVPVGTRTKAGLEVCYVTARLKQPQWTHEALEIPREEQEQALEDARTADFVASSGVYAAHPGKQCTWCEFTEQCATVQSMTALSVVNIAQAMAPIE